MGSKRLTVARTGLALIDAQSSSSGERVEHTHGRRSPMKRRTVWILVLLALGGGAAGLMARGSRRSAGVTRFETAKVERGRIVARVTASGTLSALITVQIGTQVSGRIKELYADFNSSVRK